MGDTGNRENRCAYRYEGCAGAVPKGARVCGACRLEHNRRAAERRERLKAARRCWVCQAKAVKVDGVWLTVCAAHREYFRAREPPGEGTRRRLARERKERTR